MGPFNVSFSDPYIYHILQCPDFTFPNDIITQNVCLRTFCLRSSERVESLPYTLISEIGNEHQQIFRWDKKNPSLRQRNCGTGLRVVHVPPGKFCPDTYEVSLASPNNISWYTYTHKLLILD